MPPRVCPDSEGEDDDILYEDRPSQQSTLSRATKQAEAVLAETDTDLHDDTNLRGAGSSSSSHSPVQMSEAQSGLFATASDKASSTVQAMPVSTSPVVHKNQRRHSTIVRSEPVASPTISAKRSKTTNLKTYGSKRSTTLQTTGMGAFTAVASQSSQRSGDGCSSGGLPPGSIQQNFIQHDPNVMFRDTGSTVAFNESSEQRMIESARLDNDQIGAVDKSAVFEKHESSPFPWSTSGPTQSPKSNPSKSQDGGPTPLGDQATYSENAEQFPDKLQSSETRLAADENQSVAAPKGANSSSEGDAIEVRRPPKSSPVVEIPRHEKSLELSPKAAPSSTQNSTRGRKRKCEDMAEQLLRSDEREDGLPKAQYKPRPNRRRSTQVVEDLIDYSLVPEKVTRKRRKTANATLGTEQADFIIIDRPGNGKVKLPQVDEVISKDVPGHYPKSTSVERDPIEKPPVNKQHQSHSASEKVDSPSSTISSQKQMTSAAVNNEVATDANSMAPPPLPPPSTKKGRRSKTTIYEDHVSFGGSQRSPSLRQQQASRKSVLDELPNGSTQSNMRKRRTIVQDDDGEEDELAKANPVEEDPAPKKRGRPAKAPVSKNPISAERVPEDSEAEEDRFAEDANEEVKEFPKKKARSRPQKANADDQAKADQPPVGPQDTLPSPSSGDSYIDIASSDLAAMDRSTRSSPPKAALQRKDSNRQIEVSKTTEKTTLLEKPTIIPDGKETPSPQKSAATKPSPTSHSPLKSSSLIPLRVGLSKKRKIPPLLKTFRPPPKSSTR